VIILGLAILGVAVGILWYAWRWWRRRRTAPPLAHVAALAELDQLTGMKFADPASADRFYVRVTDVLRRYLSARFHVEAPGRTTYELARALQEVPSLSEAQKAALTDLLSRADLVKFAKECPAPEATENFVAELRRFVCETGQG
jgi:hypothetical protein